MEIKSVPSFKSLINSVRNNFISTLELAVVEPDVDEIFDPTISQVYITLFQREQKPLRWGAKRENLEKTLLLTPEKPRSYLPQNKNLTKGRAVHYYLA